MDGLIETIAGLVAKIAAEGGAVVTLLILFLLVAGWRIKAQDKTIAGLTEVIADQNAHVRKQQETLLLMVAGGHGFSGAPAPRPSERQGS